MSSPPGCVVVAVRPGWPPWSKFKRWHHRNKRPIPTSSRAALPFDLELLVGEDAVVSQLAGLPTWSVGEDVADSGE